MVWMFAEKGDKIVQAATPPTTSSSAKESSSSASGVAAIASPSPAVLFAQKEKAEKTAAAQAQLQSAFNAFGVEIDQATAHRLPLPMPPVRTAEQQTQDALELEDCLEQYEQALGFAIADVRTRDIKIPLTSVGRSAVRVKGRWLFHVAHLLLCAFLSRSKSSVVAASPTGSSPATSPDTSSGGEGGSSRRYEWFQFEYDTVFNPHSVYHMEIKWLVATGMHLEAWIKNFIKKAETRFGLQIVKIPTNQPLRSADSFHVPVPLPIPNPHVLRLLEEYLLTECGFVVDSELRGSVRSCCVAACACLDLS